MSNYSKDKTDVLPVGMEQEDTAVSMGLEEDTAPSPRKPRQPISTEAVTRPSGQKADRSVISDVVAAIADTKPELVDRLVRFEKKVRDEALERARERLSVEHKRVEALVGKFEQLIAIQNRTIEEHSASIDKGLAGQLSAVQQASQGQLSAVQQASKGQVSAVQQAAQGQLEAAKKAIDEHRHSAEAQIDRVKQTIEGQTAQVRKAEQDHANSLAQHLNAVREAETQRTTSVKQHLALIGEQGVQIKRVLAEQNDTITNLRTARDRFARELDELRQQHSQATRESARTLKDLSARFEQHQAASDQKLAQAMARTAEVEAALTQTKADLASAMGIKDRLLGHVQRVEESLEGTLIPLREQADSARTRMHELEAKLKEAKAASALNLPAMRR